MKRKVTQEQKDEIVNSVKLVYQSLSRITSSLKKDEINGQNFRMYASRVRNLYDTYQELLKLKEF